ncbi:hypothetical protein D3C80_686560 [compost metagenome]
MVHHVQRRQSGVVVALVVLASELVALLGVDHLVADARGDGPAADVDAVIEENRVGFGAATGVAIVAAGGGRQLVGADRFAVA